MRGSKSPEARPGFHVKINIDRRLHEKIKPEKTVEALGYNVERVIKGYNFRSIFATDKAGQLWYFWIEDLRDTEPIIGRRTAESITDYKGGQNRFDVEEQAKAIGIEIVEPRKACDYN